MKLHQRVVNTYTSQHAGVSSACLYATLWCMDPYALEASDIYTFILLKSIQRPFSQHYA